MHHLSAGWRERRCTLRSFGAPWRKATTFLKWNFSIMQELAPGCSSKGYLCDVTQEPHRVLQGNSPVGVPWTKAAEPYPNPLRKEYARLIRELQYPELRQASTRRNRLKPALVVGLGSWVLVSPHRLVGLDLSPPPLPARASSVIAHGFTNGADACIGLCI